MAADGRYRTLGKVDRSRRVTRIWKQRGHIDGFKQQNGQQWRGTELSVESSSAILYFCFYFLGTVIGQNEVGDGFTQTCCSRLSRLWYVKADDHCRHTFCYLSLYSFMSRGYVTSWCMVGREGDPMTKPSRKMLNYLQHSHSRKNNTIL